MINRNNNYEQLGNFHQLDFTSWANHVMSSSVNKNTVDSTDLKPLSSTNKSKKSKTLKQTKVTNSFKTIVNAAKVSNTFCFNSKILNQVREFKLVFSF